MCVTNNILCNHHAIIPTAKKLQSATLTKDEKNIYQLVSRHYLAQFYPEYIYKQSQEKKRN